MKSKIHEHPIIKRVSKHLTLLIISFVICFSKLQAQDKPIMRKNVITFNIVAFPSVNYERFISERRSFSIGGIANFFPLPTGAVSAFADFRFHPKPKTEKTYNDTKDAFFGPFIKYTNRTGAFVNELAIDLDHQLGFGLMFGVQKISAKGFVMGILGGIGPSVLMIDDGFTSTWFDDTSSIVYRFSLYIGFAK